MKQILFIIGSLRTKSFNRQLSVMARELIGDRANVSELDYRNLPLVNQDIEQNEHPEVARVRQQVAAADALWIFTPEYNYSYPGYVKNLIDWLSRPVVPMDYVTPTCIAGKPVTISGAGGKAATANCRARLTELLTFVKADVIAEQTGVVVPAESWTTDVLTLNEAQRTQLAQQVETVLQS